MACMVPCICTPWNLWVARDCNYIDHKLQPENVGNMLQLWNTWKTRCYHQYLDEVTDGDNDDSHVYHSLRMTIETCRKPLQDLTEPVKDTDVCYRKITKLAKICLGEGESDCEDRKSGAGVSKGYNYGVKHHEYRSMVALQAAYERQQKEDERKQPWNPFAPRF